MGAKPQVSGGLMGHRPSYATYLGGCRCDGCRAAAIDSYRVKRTKEKETAVLVERTRTAHGTPKSYNLGCRCERCEVAEEVRQEVRRRRTEKTAREEWMNRMTFAQDEPEDVVEEDDLSDEELQSALADDRLKESEQDFHFEDIL
jgi:hypothetical protein